MSEGAFVFLAALPERANFTRHQDGATLRLDIPETEVPHMIGVLALNHCVLRVSVELINKQEATGHDVRQRQKRKPGRQAPD